MVEYKAAQLDSIFSSLADPTRRDILKRVAHRELSINEIASAYQVSLAAISKHLKVLERAKLVSKRKSGKQHFVALSPPAFKEASQYLEHYKNIWEERLDRLDLLLKE